MSEVWFGCWTIELEPFDLYLWHIELCQYRSFVLGQQHGKLCLHATELVVAGWPARSVRSGATQPGPCRRTVALPPQALAATAAPTADSSAYYQSTGVRKAVVLARYMDLVRNW